MRFRLLLVAVLVSLAVGVNAQEQTARPPDSSVSAELVKLNATLREIADLLAKQAEQTSLDLLMKRTQMAQGLLERTETQLQRLLSEQRAIDDELSRLQLRREEMRDAPAAEREAVEAEVDALLKHLSDRRRGLNAEIMELQNRIAARQDELRAWQVVLDRRLGGQ